MNTKEYKTVKEMNEAHQEILLGFNNTIEDSYKTYVERAEEKGFNMWTEDVIDSQTAEAIKRDLLLEEHGIYNDSEYDADFGCYIEEANLSPRGLQYGDSDNTFSIGNNISGGI